MVSPVELVRTMQGIYEDVPEPGENAAPHEHLVFIGARFARWLLSWQGVTVWAIVVAAAFVLDVST